MADEEELHEEELEELVEEEQAEDVAEDVEEAAAIDEEVHSPAEEAAAEAGDEEAVDEEEEFPWEKMIEELGVGDKEKFVVRLRQHLRTPKRASRFVAELADLIDSRRAEDKDTIIEDFDISQNLIPAEQFEEMCSALADSSVQVERFRAFGSPALDDQAALLLAGWLVAVPEDRAPFEMHLSDCAIQTDGFLELTKAFQENDAFPPKDPRNPDRGQIPLYLRLEGNYIEESVIQERIDDGTFMTMRKNDRPYYTADHKVRLLLRDDGKLAQKEGPPPPPEDAPPPKRVHDKGSKGKGEKGKGKDKDRDKGKGKGKSREAPWERRQDSGKGKGRSAVAALPARSSWERERERPAPWSSRSGGASSRAASGGRRDGWESRDSRGSSRYSDDRASSSRYSSDRGREDRNGRRDTSEREWNRAGERVSGRSSQTSGRAPLKRPVPERNGRDEEAKRPRSSAHSDRQSSQAAPTKRINGSTAVSRPTRKEPQKPGARQKENGGKLPGPWEEHWSEEYGLHYFWNSKTGDSTWERPTA